MLTISTSAVSIYFRFIFRSANFHHLQSNLHSDPTEDTSLTSISVNDIRKLLLDSIELQKMKVTNQKLKDALNEKHAEIRKLQKKLYHYEKTGELSSVSEEEPTYFGLFTIYDFFLSMNSNYFCRKSMKYWSV